MLVALAALDRGGTVAVAENHLSDVPVLSYEVHLIEERTAKSVTFVTRADGEASLEVADRIKVRPTTVAYPFERVDRALSDHAPDRFSGVAVIRVVFEY